MNHKEKMLKVAKGKRIITYNGTSTIHRKSYTATRKPLDVIDEFSKVAVYKINIQKSVVNSTH